MLKFCVGMLGMYGRRIGPGRLGETVGWGCALSCIGVAAVLAALTGSVHAQQPQGAGKGIYTCIGPDGKPIVGDRRIPDCMDKPQTELNKDGSSRRVVPPPPTADEQAKFDRELQEMREARASKDEAAKYDRLLKVRYRNEQAHDRARDAALERLRSAMASSEKRVIDLADERKRLLEEAEFFKGRKMPDPLRQRIETNAAGTAAQRQLMKQQQDQINDIDRQYDAERQRLRKLWDGAQPGTVGPVPRSDAVKTAG